MQKISTKLSNVLYVLRAFACLTVVAAHMSFGDSFYLAETIKKSIAQIGVFVFFILSGYFYSRSASDSKKFWCKKAKTFILPWFIFASAVYCLSVLVFSKGGVSVLDGVKYVLGITSIYWYMLVLTVLMVLFKFFNKDIWLYIFMGISVISLIASNILAPNHYSLVKDYLLYTNWAGVFAFGMLLRRKDMIEKLINPIYAAISLIALTGLVIIDVIREKTLYHYVSETSLFIEFFGFILLLNLAYYLSNSVLLSDIGKKSFFIYLIHVQIVGIINTRLPYNALFFILRPFIGLAVCYVLALLLKWFLKLTKTEKFSFVFGLDR